MALPTGVQGVFAPVNVTGLLLAKTDTRTPLFNMLGGVAVGAREFVVGSDFELDTAEQPAITEDASMEAPDPSYDSPTQVKNVTQMFHRSVAASYRKSSNVDALTGLHLAGQANNVSNPLAFALANRTAEIRNDIEFTILNGTYNLATTSAQADKTRGLNAAITTNVTAAGGAELGPDMIIEVARDIVARSPYGLDGIVGILNAEQIVQLNKIVTNEGQRIGATAAGSALYSYLTPFGVVNFMQGGHRYQPNGTATFARLGSCRNVLQPVPGKGNFFYEPLAKTGASESGQIFGQWGFDHGHEWLHAKITGLAETTAASTAPKVFVTNDADAPVYTYETGA